MKILHLSTELQIIWIHHFIPWRWFCLDPRRKSGRLPPKQGAPRPTPVRTHSYESCSGKHGLRMRVEWDGRHKKCVKDFGTETSQGRGGGAGNVTQGFCSRGELAHFKAAMSNSRPLRCLTCPEAILKPWPPNVPVFVILSLKSLLV